VCILFNFQGKNHATRHTMKINTVKYFGGGFHALEDIVQAKQLST
jgi:hypothetical protein